MTKTELQKQRVKAVLDFLTNKFDAEIDDNGEGGRLDITIGEFDGQIMRRDLQVQFWDAIRLVGQFTPSKWQHHLKAVELEKQINTEIEKVLGELSI